MSVTLTGKVFNDLQHTGICHSHYPGIPNILVVLKCPDHTLLTTHTDHYGIYTFSNLNLPGSYIIYEESTSPSDHNYLLEQPLGLNGSTTVRKYHFSISNEQLLENQIIDSMYFGHDFNESFQSTHLAYTLDSDGHSLHTLNLITGATSFITLLPTQGIYSILAFNNLDYFIYGYAPHLGQLFRLSANGTLILYTIPYLPNKNFTVGDIDVKGHLYLYEPLDHTCYVVDINPSSSTYMYLLDPYNNLLEATAPTGYVIEPLDIIDWCFNPTNNYFYSINTSGQVLCITPQLNQIQYLTTTGTPSSSAHTLIADYKGYLYALFDNICTIYRIVLSQTSAICETFSPLPSAHFTKGVRCHHAPTYIQLGTAPDLSTLNTSGNYTTLLSHNGPRHGVTSVLSFKHDKQSSLPALYLTDSLYTLNVPIINHTEEDAYLYGWLDFNSNGIFESTEAIDPLIIPHTLDEPFDACIQFTIADSSFLTLGNSYIRLRLTTDYLVNHPDPISVVDTRSIGPASDGQVLDLPLKIVALPPMAPDLSAQICEMNQNLMGSCKFTDENNGNLSYTISKPPLHGVASVHPISGKWTYTPHEHYFGKDTFTLSATSSTTHLTGSLPIDISIQSADLKVTTSPTPCEVLAGDTLLYTTTIENTGTVLLSDLMYIHALPVGTSFVSSSVLINGIRDMSARPEYGFNLPKLSPNEVCSVSFQILIGTPSSHFSSRGTVQGHYFLTPTTSSSSLSKDGNLVEGILKSPNLSLEFTSNTSEVFIEDTVQYIAKITNTGDLPLCHIKFTLSLPDELEYTHHLTCNHIPLAADLCSGYVLEHLEPNESISLQFFSKVISNSPNLLTTLFASYDYKLNEDIKSSRDCSAQCELSVCSPKLELSKTCSRQALSIGEVFTYVITASNKGSLSVDDVVIKDALPREFQVVDIYCNNKPLLNTLETGLSIGKLPPSASCDLIIKLKVVSIPFNKAFTPQAALGIFKVCLDPSLPPKLIYIESPTPKSLPITDAALKLDKSSSVSEASVGETITYNISITNVGTVLLSQVTIRDLLCPELKFIPDSLTLDGQPLINASLMSSIVLDTLPPGASRLLSFDATILGRGTGLLENTCSAYYTYRPHMSSYSKSGSSTSNPCTLTIRQAHLSLSSKVNEAIAFLNDNLHYTIRVTNDGDMDTFNVLLTNLLDGCELVDGSFTINGLTIHSVELSQAINIGAIPRGESIIISYQTQVVGHCHFEDTLVHQVYANFSYDTIDHCIKYDKTESVSLSIPLALSTFKQLSLDNFLELTSNNPNMEVINSVGGQVSLLKHYTIQTPTGTSLEGQKLSGNKLIVHALLELSVEYVAGDVNQSIHSVNYSIPFSTFIVLPKQCPLHSPIRIDATIENISFKVTSTRSFFTNSAILLVARIK